MEFQRYETYQFYQSHSFNVARQMEERSYNNHWHSYGEIIRVGSEDMNIYKVNQNIYHLEENDLVLIWPMEQHEIIDADLKNSVIIQFGNDFARSMFDVTRIMHYFHDLHVIRRKNHPGISVKLCESIEEMKNIFRSKGRNRESRCIIELLNFMMLLDENRHELMADIGQEPSSALSDQTMKSLLEVTDHVKANLATEDISQAAMAERAGISKEYFSRIFKDLTGLNYTKWLNMIRIENAISLFENEDMKLTEIAMLSGFQSIPSFNRVFKELKGISPREYRNKHE